MTYLRVIPRDLFNEANLLKCLGRLALINLRGGLPKGWCVKHSSHDFAVHQNSADGGIWCSNVLLVHPSYGSMPLERPLNTRKAWNLVTSDYVEVFDGQGNLSTEMVEHLNNLT